MSSIGNPFVECTSRDMSYLDVFRYWCDPFRCYKIDYALLQKSTTPIIVEGPRGSGKTMILKYISYYCQKEMLAASKVNNPKSEITKLIKNGTIGVYFRYKEDFGSLFKLLNCSQNTKDQLFLYYFELYVLEEIINILIDIERHGLISAAAAHDFVANLNNTVGGENNTLTDVFNCFEDKIRMLDSWVRNSRYMENAERDVSDIIGNEDIRSICKNISESFDILRNIRFIIIIDEYENAGRYQRILNTLIKQVDEKTNISYRIGVRPMGIETFNTNLSTEFLQKDRDYVLFELLASETTPYKLFLEEVARRRLNAIPFYSDNNLTSIKELLGARENLDVEANDVVKGSKKHFDVVFKENNIVLSPEEMQQIAYRENPLMEMLNIIWVLRGISPSTVSAAMNGYLKGEYKANDMNDSIELAKKYKLDYSDKYRFQLMSILLGIYGKNKKYYSFNTFAYLSSGSVNDFISLCRNVFYHVTDDCSMDIIKDRRIPIETQSKGAEETAVEQLDKIRLSCDHGLEMYSFAFNMGGVFREYHRDKYAKYPETNQFAFENEVEISNRPLLEDVYCSLIKWGVIIKKPRIQGISIGRRKGRLYYLNRMLCPIFGISYRTRGGFNFVVTTSLFERLLKGEVEPETIINWKESEKKIMVKENDKNNNKQISIFEVM